MTPNNEEERSPDFCPECGIGFAKGADITDEMEWHSPKGWDIFRWIPSPNGTYAVRMKPKPPSAEDVMRKANEEWVYNTRLKADRCKYLADALRKAGLLNEVGS